MSALVRAELLKLRTTRTSWLLVLAGLAFVPVSVALGVVSADAPGAAALGTSAGVRHVLSAASSGTTLVMILGILAMTGEFRHGTGTATFLVTPGRGRVVVAKLVAATLVGLGVAAAASVVTVAVGVPWLATKDVDVSLLSGDVGYVLLGALLATALYALVGVGVGALVRSQVAALTVSLVWVTVVEALVVGFLPDVGRWLPGGAAAALTFVPTPNGGLLPMWGAVLLLTGYGLAFAAVGSRLVVARDIV